MSDLLTRAQVERFDEDDCRCGLPVSPASSPEGEFVRYSDYAALRARVEAVERERDIYKTIAADNCRHADDRLNVIEEMATEVADLTAKCEELERDVDMAHDCLQQSGEYVADLTARLAAAPPITAQEARPGEPGATWYETKGTS